MEYPKRKHPRLSGYDYGQDGVYCVHAGWSGHGWGFTIGAHYAGANVTDAVFFQGAEIDTIRLNGSTYGTVQRYMPG